METNGLFNIAGFESAGEDDLLSMSVNEEAEFKDHCPSMDPTQSFDAANSGEKSVSVPGGDSERPSAKPADGEMGPSIPGGDSETPHSKPEGATAVPNVAKTTLTSEEYNSTLASLQKSFKEATDIIGTLMEAQVINKSEDELQEEYTESVIGEAIVQSLESGPVFERVDRSDKSDVKKIVGDIRSKVEKACASQDTKFYQPKLWARIIVGGISTAAGGIGTSHFVAGVQQAISHRIWQILGICYQEEGNISKLTDALNKQFADELGEYKILYAKTSKTIVDAFKTHFGWKDTRDCYMLIVDKKLPDEIAKMQSEISDMIKKGDGEGAAASKEEKK